MQNFFGLKLRFTVVFLVLAGFGLTHLPQHHAVKEYNTFSNWVMQHLSGTETGADSDIPNNERLRTLIQEMMSGSHPASGSTDCPNDRTRFIPYLYLAWSQHHDASDMAGTFSHERLHFQLILKHHAAMLSGHLFSASGSETYPAFLYKSLRSLRADLTPFRLLALVSGQSVNAP